MYRYRAFNLNFSSEVFLSECTAGTGEQDDFVIIQKKLTPPPLETTNLFRKGIVAQSIVDADGSLWLHWNGVATFHAVKGATLEVDVLTDVPDVLSLFTVSEAIGLILFQKGDFLLHASAVEIAGSGWIFIGNPGAGKSTTCAAFVTAGCPLLSDDLTAIRFDARGVPFIIPAYPQIKIWESSARGLGYQTETLTPVTEGTNKFSLQPRKNFPVSPVPLERFIFISPSGQESGPFKPGNLPTELIRHFPLPNQLLNPENLKTFFEQSILCAKRIPGNKIPRPDGFEALNQWVTECLARKPLPLPQ